MPEYNGKFLGHISELDSSRFLKSLTEEEIEKHYALAIGGPQLNLRAFVAAVREYPNMLSSWDVSMTFDEFARRVEVGGDDFSRWPNLRHFSATEEFEAMLRAQDVDTRFSTKHPVAPFPRFGDMEEEIARAKEMAEHDGYC